MSLDADHNGAPGATLGYWSDLAGLWYFGQCCSLMSVTGISGITLTAGTNYWLVIGPSNYYDSTYGVWNFSNGAIANLDLSLTGGGNWINVGLRPEGAFQVLGTPTLPQVSWVGGGGNWNNSLNWSGGVPGVGRDVLIYSGGSDNATLDVNSTVTTLTVGGAANNTTSTLTDGGAARNLTIVTALTVGQTGSLNFTGGSNVTAGTLSDPPAGTLNNSGNINIGGGSTLTITGDALNNGLLLTSYSGAGGNTLNIGGALTNNGSLNLYGPGDMATLGRLDNSGQVLVENGSTLQINGDLNNFVSGAVHVESSTLQVNGNLNNFGTLLIDPSILTITGTLTNNVGSTFSLTAGDKLNAGTVNNLGSFTLPTGTQLSTTMFSSAGSTTLSALATLLVGTGSAGNTGYYQLANGTLGENISTAGSGVIVVNGAAHVDGTLDILLQAGFNPPVGSTYEFLTFNPGLLSGTFASVQNDIFDGGYEQWAVIYNDAGGYVELQAIPASPTPEPSSYLLLGTGLLAGIGILRRKMML